MATPRRLALVGAAGAVVLTLGIVALVVAGTGHSAPSAHGRQAPAGTPASGPLMLPQSEPAPTMLPQSPSPTEMAEGDRGRGPSPVRTPSASRSASPSPTDGFPCDDFQDLDCDTSYWASVSPS